MGMKIGRAIAGSADGPGHQSAPQVRSRSSLLFKWIDPVSQFLDFWLESPCPLCQRSAAHTLCPTCHQRAQSCQYSQLLQPQPPNSLAVLAWGDYRGDIQRMMRLLKYENQPKLGTIMGQWLALAWLAQRPFHQIQSRSTTLLAPVIVPIPLHHKKLQQRGYNQTELIAQEFCRMTQLRFVRQGLERVRETQPQFSLSVQARNQNLSQAFQSTDALKPYSNYPILLLDDIHTTGATARSATQALRQAGFKVAGIMTVAKPSRSASNPQQTETHHFSTS